MEDAGLKRLANHAHRRTVTSKVYGYKGKPEPDSVIVEVIEIMPPDRHRSVSTSTSNGRTQRTERITIGEKEFQRDGAGSWRKLKPQGDRFTMLPDAAVTSTCKYLGGADVGGRKLDLYERKVVREYAQPSSLKTLENVIRLWVASDGTIVKSELTRLEDGSKEYLHSVSEYELDSKIKIVAPIR